MADRVDVARVMMWGHLAGAVAWDADRAVATFEFDPGFLDLGLDLAPLTMPLAEARAGRRRFVFPALPPDTFHGLPGLLADALPDAYGQALIDQWLERQGREPGSFNPVERLCYTGKRAMGALEFEPALVRPLDRSVAVAVDELVALANSVLSRRAQMRGVMEEETAQAPEVLRDILRVGTSAGGARPKAVIALDDATGAVRSGQVSAPPGFDYWILKFDGVHGGGLGDPAGYGRIEYAYARMAAAAGVTMTECRLFEEHGRAHFMTRRFDRGAEGAKVHLQSLCALEHADYRAPRAYSYEQVFATMRRLGLDYADAEQMLRRMVFNVAARNQDDHTKNIAFLMDGDGRWRLAPAFDMTFAYRPGSPWVDRHQLTLAGKGSGFTRDDLVDVGRDAGVKRADRVVDEVVAAVARWPEFAAEGGVPEERRDAIGAMHRSLAD